MSSSTKSNPLPQDVHVQFIRSLYDNVHMILIGAFCHVLMTFMSYWSTGQQIYLGLAVMLGAIGLWRYASMSQVVKEARLVDHKSAERSEKSYLVAGSLQGLALGIYCFVAIYVVSDSFSELASLSVALCSLVTVAGRNYGSRSMVAIFGITILGPIASSLILRGDIYYITLGLLIFPFLFVLKGTADHVRYVLYSAVMGQKQARQLAQRFDRALNTMSHGLVMFDSSNFVVVANSRAAEMVSLRSADRMVGRSLSALLSRGVAGGLLSTKESRSVEQQLARALREPRDRKLLVSLADGRHIEFSARDGANDLGVITFEDVTPRVAAEERVRFMARYDSLTGLPNRAYFHEIVADRMANGERDRLCALIILDLDDFKSVNDTLGHPVGDGLIYAMANRLREIALDQIAVSRFGGDEFVLFVDKIRNEDELVELLTRIVDQLSGEVDVSGHMLRMQFSSGAVLANVDTEVDAMFVKADLALYKAKDDGKHGWCIFENSMDDAFRRRQIMKADLRTAVEARELHVVYQPIIDSATMRIVGCEALCRWNHPVLGAISPSIFIPLAEEMGIISDISRFVLDTACRECASWPDHMTVSINFSAKDFRSGNMVDSVSGALERSGLRAGRLEVEVTETALFEDRMHSRQHLSQLKELGIKLALDDFGTGYSNLSYVHTLPFDRIKIDRSFISDLSGSERSQTLLQGIVALSRSLGLSVTMEGVETSEQLGILLDKVKPDLLQGFLFSASLSPSELAHIDAIVFPYGKNARA